MCKGLWVLKPALSLSWNYDNWHGVTTYKSGSRTGKWASVVDDSFQIDLEVKDCPPVSMATVDYPSSVECSVLKVTVNCIKKGSYHDFIPMNIKILRYL